MKVMVNKLIINSMKIKLILRENIKEGKEMEKEKNILIIIQLIYSE